MSEKEKEIATRIAEAIKVLPQDKKERWLGYAEGVTDMAARRQQETAQATVDMAAQLGA